MWNKACRTLRERWKAKERRVKNKGKEGWAGRCGEGGGVADSALCRPTPARHSLRPGPRGAPGWVGSMIQPSKGEGCGTVLGRRSHGDGDGGFSLVPAHGWHGRAPEVSFCYFGAGLSLSPRASLVMPKSA